MKSQNYLKFYAFILGFTALTTQIILLRGLYAVFYGNELCMGILLAVWLLWVAVGSYAATRLQGRPCFSRRSLFVVFQTLFFMISFAAIAVLRNVRVVTATPFGEYISLSDLLLFSLLLLALPCLLTGIQFTWLTGLADEHGRKKLGAPAIYVYESLGSAAAGMLTGFFLFPNLIDLQVLLLVTCIVFMVLFLIDRHKISLFLFAMLFITLLTPLPHRLQDVLLRQYWQSFGNGMELVDWQQSRYGELSIVEWGGDRFLYSNGSKQTQLPDPIGTQEQAALIMNQHSDPENILLIGGGLGGLAMEIARYPKVSLSYIEQDPRSLELLSRVDEKLVGSMAHHEKIQIIHTDGRRFLQQSKEAAFDLVIASVGQPFTGENNRYISREFLSLVKSRLVFDGVMVINGLPSAENYLGPELLQLNAGMYQELSLYYADVLVLPGDHALFFASKVKGQLTREPQILAARFEARGVTCDYFYSDMFWQYLLPQRLESLEASLKNAVARPHLDFRPVAYYYDFLLWDRMVRHGGSLGSALLKLSFDWVAGFIVLCGLLLMLVFLKFRHSRIGFCLSQSSMTIILGFTAMALNVLLIFAFQVLFGYIYEWIGLALGLYMLGMAMAGHLFDKFKTLKKILFLYFIFLILYLLLIWPVIGAMQALYSPVLYLFLVFISGAVSGAWFPLVYARFKGHSSKAAGGIVYAADVLGGALGAVVISGICFPLFGFQQTAGLLVVLCLFAFGFSLLPGASE